MAVDRTFLDSNILCYLIGNDPAKADRASELLADRPTTTAAATNRRLASIAPSRR